LDLGLHAERTGRRIDADLVLLQAAALATGPRSASAALPAWLQDAIDALRLSPLVAGGVPSLAKLCGRSPVHLRRVIRAHLGCTPTALITRLRLERAAKLLLHRGASVAEAAQAVGLPNPGHFHALFKEHFGVSPARFRRTAGG
jgi:AraC-like DNA-binding protein